jgi:hypothetical protein
MSTGGMYIGAPGTVGQAIARDDGLRAEEQAQRKDQVANMALRAMLGGMGAPGTPATKSFEVNGRTIGQDREAVPAAGTPATQLGLLNKFAPGVVQSALAQQAVSQLFPQGFSGTLGENEIAFQNGREVARGAMKTEQPAKLPAEAELAKWLFGGNEAAAREYIKNKDAPKQKGQWRTLTPDEARARNLNPSGAYQVNEEGQVQVITQPKQEAPTETQAKYGYNARRVASSLAKVNEVLANDSDASSSWLLETFGDGPIASRTGMDVLARSKINPNAQIVRNNMVDAIDAVITLGTGAAYTKEQLEAARATYMPRPGEPANVKQDKFRKLLEVYEQARVNARTAGEELPDPSAFAGLFGVEEAQPMSPENDPLGIRGR